VTTAPARRRLAGCVAGAVVAGCAAAPVPCEIANQALSVSAVDWGPVGFRATVVNRAGQPLSERIFLEVAVIQDGRPVLEGQTVTAAAWPAFGTQVVPVPYAIDQRPVTAADAVYTHLKCLSPAPE
jgi:hypothetical protein